MFSFRKWKKTGTAFEFEFQKMKVNVRFVRRRELVHCTTAST